MAKNKNNEDNAGTSEGTSVAPQGSKRLGAGAIVSIAAAGVVVLLGTALAGGVAGAAIVLNGDHDRTGIEAAAEGHEPGGDKRGQFLGDHDDMRDGMRGGSDHDDDRDEFDCQRGPGAQQQGGMNRDGMNRDGSLAPAPSPETSPDTTTTTP